MDPRWKGYSISVTYTTKDMRKEANWGSPIGRNFWRFWGFVNRIVLFFSIGKKNAIFISHTRPLFFCFLFCIWKGICWAVCSFDQFEDYICFTLFLIQMNVFPFDSTNSNQKWYIQITTAVIDSKLLKWRMLKWWMLKWPTYFVGKTLIN